MTRCVYYSKTKMKSKMGIRYNENSIYNSYFSGFGILL